MSLSRFTGAARALALGLGMAALGTTPVFAQAPAPVANPMDIAPQIVAASKVTCQPVGARIVGPTETLGADLKMIKANLYEIACEAGPGFIVTVITPEQVKEPFSCNLLAKIREKDPASISCALPQNMPIHKWLTPVVKPFLPGCEVTKARLIGSTTDEPKIDRYEVGCAAGAGGVIDYAQFGSTAATEYKNCLMFEGTNSACTFTTKEQLIESLKPLAASANAGCQITDVRFVGVTKDNDGSYYEFGCATPPGFIALADLQDKYVRTVACASAMGLGGCKFTDAGLAAADANTYMTTTLKANGYDCNVKEYNLIGTQETTKRDYVEFRCEGKPWGLVGFVPQPGSDGQTRVYDCFMDQIGRKACTYVSQDDLLKQFDKLIKIAQPGKDCDVKEVRYVGEFTDTEDAVLAELACVNKRGYIVIVAPDRNSLIDAIPCTIAKSQKLAEQCSIPGNGTYASAGGAD